MQSLSLTTAHNLFTLCNDPVLSLWRPSLVISESVALARVSLFLECQIGRP